MRFVIVTVIALGLGGLLFWGLFKEDTARQSALVDKPAPMFDIPTLKPYQAQYGERIKLEDFIGKSPVVVNFWASWCPPCRVEAPMLEATWKEYQDRLQFIGVDFQDPEQAALDFIAEFGLSFPSGADPQGRIGIDFGTYGLPETFFIDLKGNVLARHVGAINATQLRQHLDDLLAQTGPTASVQP